MYEGCRSAGIGCIECKGWAADALVQVLRPIQERRAGYSEPQVKEILKDGSLRAEARAEADHGRSSRCNEIDNRSQPLVPACAARGIEMEEKNVPWWRRALSFALGGIRSGFGLFSRPQNHKASVPSETVAGLAETPEEKAGLSKQSPVLALLAADTQEAEPAAPVEVATEELLADPVAANAYDSRREEAEPVQALLAAGNCSMPVSQPERLLATAEGTDGFPAAAARLGSLTESKPQTTAVELSSSLANDIVAIAEPVTVGPEIEELSVEPPEPELGTAFILPALTPEPEAEAAAVAGVQKLPPRPCRKKLPKKTLRRSRCAKFLGRRRFFPGPKLRSRFRPPERAFPRRLQTQPKAQNKGWNWKLRIRKLNPRLGILRRRRKRRSWLTLFPKRPSRRLLRKRPLPMIRFLR